MKTYKGARLIISLRGPQTAHATCREKISLATAFDAWRARSAASESAHSSARSMFQLGPPVVAVRQNAIIPLGVVDLIAATRL